MAMHTLAEAEYLARKQVIIATVTRYDDPNYLRVPLAYQTAEMASEYGYPLAVVDGSPDEVIKKELTRRGAKVFPDIGNTLGSAKRQSFFHAMELALELPHRLEFLVYIEAEKYFIIPHIPTLIASLVDQHAHVVVATRSKESWQTWPEFQVKTEREANDSFARIFGLQLDITHGPGAFRIREAGGYFCNGALYLDAGVSDTYVQHFSVIVAHKFSLKVVPSVPLDVKYPKEQKKAETSEIAAGGNMKQKRIHQRDTLYQDYQKLFDHLCGYSQ